MPRVKIDYVVSFSSEDPENQANNIVEWEVSKKKWLCSKGESSCSIVLQLVKAVKIESINIGAHHAASVEVLVGLSEKPNEPFQVLVPSCMLLSPAESRGAAGVERVRAFSGAQLGAARERRWDRVRVVCAQPYNRHCKYGLSFVHIHEPESTLSRTFAFGALAADDDEFRPGELFASARRTTTEAQIRQASMDAIKNDSDKYTKLIKIPIAKTTGKESRGEDDEPCSNRRKENLMYTDEDIKPHDKIDQVVQRHKQQKDEENLSHNQRTREHQDKEKIRINNIDRDSKKNKTPTRDPQQQVGATNSSPQSKVVRKDTPSTADSSHSKKRRRSDDEPGPRARRAAVLAGVAFTLSGYENPLRAELRDVGLRLGARYLPGWRGCTHLVCAFPNTPKVREARAGGGRAAAVAGEWLRACAARRRRLPWRWFAVQPSEREAPPADWQLDRPDSGGDSDMDTDDEIEKVLQHQRKKNKTNSPVADDDSSAPPATDVVDDANASRESDVTFVRDERVRDNITLDDSDCDSDLTDRDDQPAPLEKIDTEKELPHFFEGLTFTISDDLDAEYDRALLVRYIRAYGGLVVEAAAALAGRAQLHVCGGACGAGGACVRPEWVWRCHRARSLLADGR